MQESTDLVSMSDTLSSFQQGEKTLLAVDVAIGGKGFALRRITQESDGDGLIVGEDEETPWRSAGLRAIGETVYLLGDHVKGRTLYDLWTDENEDAESRLKLLARLSTLLPAAYERLGGFRELHMLGVVVLEDTRILVLPPRMMEMIGQSQRNDDRLRFVSRYNHPDLGGEEAMTYALAALAYTALTETPPFDATTIDETNNEVRRRKVFEAHYREPRVRPDVSRDLTAALSIGRTDGSTRKSFEFAKFRERLHEWASKGAFEPVSDSQRQAIVDEAEELSAKIEKRYRRSEWVRKYWSRVALIAAIVVVVGSIPLSILSNALKPRVTAGFPPQEVVRTFYTSITELDHMTMEDCVVGDAGKGYINEAMNLYVMSRMRMSVEMTDVYVDPQQWREAGRPDLADNLSLFGVTDLEIVDKTQTSAPEGERLYEVTFMKWYPDYPEDVDLENPPSRVRDVADRIVERLIVVQDREDWVISEITRVSSERVADPQ